MGGAVKLAIGIAHAAFDARRRAPLERLVAELGGASHFVTRSTEREHASVWSERLWLRGVLSDADAVLFLNDDVRPIPQLHAIASAMLEARPLTEAFALHTSTPIAATLRAAGQPWCRCYWMTGPAYMLRRPALERLVAFARMLPDAFRRTVNEDVVGIHWAWSEQRPFWSSIPALVRHDVSVPSTLGYDEHPLRTSCVDWRDDEIDAMTSPDFWRGEDAAPLLENPWMSREHMAAVARDLRAVGAMGNFVCGFCLSARAVTISAKTGAAICAKCAGKIAMAACEAVS